MYLIAIAILVIILAIITFVVSFKAPPLIRNSYLFWIIFSYFFLDNWYAFGFVFPPILPFFIPRKKEINEFLSIPFGVSLCAVAVVIVLCLLFPKLYKRINKQLVPILFNGLFLATFLISGDYYKEDLISKALIGHNPDCISINTFLTSIKEVGKEFQFTPHAIFTEDGKMFFWSYSEKNFFLGGESLTRNFKCYSNYKLLPDGKLVKI